MEELTKKDILVILGENLTDIRHSGYKTEYSEEGDIDEMAIEKYKTDPKTGERVLNYPKWPTGKKGIPNEKPERKRRAGAEYSAFRPMFYPPYETEDKKEAEEHVGWYYTPQGEDGNGDFDKTTPIIFTCEWDELIERSPDLVQMLKDKYGKVKFVNDNCPTDTSRSRSGGTVVAGPIPGEEGEPEEFEKNSPKIFTTPEDEIEKNSTRNILRTQFNEVLKERIFRDVELRDQMKKLSLPPLFIKNSDNVYGEDRKQLQPHVNRFSVTNNELVEFATHSVQLYKTQNDFLQHTTTSLRSEPKDIPDVVTTAVGRKYTPRYTPNSVTRLSQKGNFGKTEILGLDRYRIPEDDFEVLVNSDFDIKGEAINKDEEGNIIDWSWTINYKLVYGKRSPEDNRVRNTNTDAEINKKVTVTLPQPTQFDGKYQVDRENMVNIDKSLDYDTGTKHPLTNETVLKGLETVLDEFKAELMSTNPNKSVQRAISSIDKLGARALRPQQTQMNEDEIRDFVKQTLLNK